MIVWTKTCLFLSVFLCRPYRRKKTVRWWKFLCSFFIERVNDDVIFSRKKRFCFLSCECSLSIYIANETNNLEATCLVDVGDCRHAFIVAMYTFLMLHLKKHMLTYFVQFSMDQHNLFLQMVYLGDFFNTCLSKDTFVLTDINYIT